MKFVSPAITIFFIFLLTACGGGDGSGGSSTPTQPSNNSPTVNISDLAETNSSDIISLTANATDSDGSIASYAWSVDSTSITLTDANKSQVSFIAPGVGSDATISLSVTVTDNKGATAKATKQITVKKQESLTITGLVLDGGVIPNADVVFAVGDATFATKANAAGQYSITINVSNKNLNTPITATAVGDSANPTVKLASQLYSVSKLIEQAGTDKTLDAKENLAVNISNLTTAEYVLLRTPTSWGFNTPIATDEQLQLAQNSIGSYQKISMASYLQIIATDSKFKLPDTNKNTLDFLQDQAAVTTFYNQVYIKDFELISNTKTLINADKNLVKSIGSIASQYLLYNLSGTNSYRLTLNEDLTGKLEAGNFTASIKWTQDGSKLTLNFPVPMETSELGSNSRFIIKTAELNIYNNYSDYSLANFILFGDKVYSGSSQGYASDQSMTVISYDTAKLVPLTAEKIAGEWMSNYGNYQFNADKTALYKTYNDPNQAATSSWLIDNNKLVLKANNTNSEEIYVMQDIGAGYSYLKIYNYQGAPFRFSTGFLIKPQNNVQLKKSDFVGRWIDKEAPIATNVPVRVMASDNLLFTNFGSWPTPWSSKEGSNSWERNIYLQNGEWTSYCDFSVGTYPDCQLYKKYTNKVIAINGDQYYSLRAEAFYLNSGESSVDYSLVQSTKLPKITYFGQWMTTDNAVKVFYQKTAGGIKVWSFHDNSLVVNNKTLGNNFFSENAITFSLTNNRLQYMRDNVARELMLVNASENGLTVCEYNQGASCTAGTEFLLSNRNPAKISLIVEGAGTISSYMPVDLATWFGNTVKFKVRPDAGALVKSVTGCGGQLSGNDYLTTEVRDACTITATFSKIPVITLKAGAHGAIKNFSGYDYSITPDVGYMVETATGCNGVLTDGQYPSYAIKDVPAEDCTITVNFKQKLSIEAKISDQGLASCLDLSNVKDIKLVTQLDCQNDVVSSLEGIQNLPSLNSLTIAKVASLNNITVPELDSLRTLSVGRWDQAQPLLDVTAIDVSKVRNLTHLFIYSTKIISLDLSMLFNLHQASIQNNPGLTTLDLRGTRVQAVFVGRNNLQELKLPAGVVNLFANNNQLTNIDLSGSPELTWLDLTGNKFAAFNLEPYSKLIRLSLGDNLLTELNVSNLRFLTHLQAESNKLKQLDVSKNVALEYLEAGSNQLKDISLVNLEKLSYLDLSKNELSSIDLRVSPELWGFKVESNNLTMLDVGAFTKIMNMTAFDNKLTTIKGVESISAESYIDMHANPFDTNTLAYLNNLKTVKNYTALDY